MEKEKTILTPEQVACIRNFDEVPGGIAAEICDSHEALRLEVERLREQLAEAQGSIAASEKLEAVYHDSLRHWQDRATTAERKELILGQRAPNSY